MNQAHSSIQKAANIAGLGSNLRLIPSRGNNVEGDEVDGRQSYSLDGDALVKAMRTDEDAGLTPTFVNANVGSTNSCAIDSVRVLGEACRR